MRLSILTLSCPPAAYQLIHSCLIVGRAYVLPTPPAISNAMVAYFTNFRTNFGMRTQAGPHFTPQPGGAVARPRKRLLANSPMDSRPPYSAGFGNGTGPQPQYGEELTALACPCDHPCDHPCGLIRSGEDAIQPHAGV